MNELNEKEIEQVSGGRATYTYNCANFVLKSSLPAFLAGAFSNECVNCEHFTGDNQTVCDLK